MSYEWIKVVHIIFVIFWMAGLFMLPRFFVYHQEAVQGSAEDIAWVERERRLLRIILTPAMIVTWILGLVMAVQSQAFVQTWFSLKMLAVIGLSGYHGWMSAYAKKLARGERPLAGKSLRLLNEVPGLAAVIIVILVVIKPFS
jgi:protoporphyrinogen IX oxidase